MTVPLFAEEPVPVSNRCGGVEDVIEVVGGEVRIQGLVNLTFDAVPAGATLLLDGIAHTAPFVYDTLICGPRRRLLAVRLYGERFEPVTDSSGLQSTSSVTIATVTVFVPAASQWARTSLWSSRRRGQTLSAASLVATCMTQKISTF